MPLSAYEFERRLIFYASPTLTKLKVACIYNLNDLDDLEECIQYYNELLNKKDIYLKVLKIKGKEHLSVGYWKVYSHVKNCQHTFDKYHKCTHELCKRFNQGESVEQICRYV